MLNFIYYKLFYLGVGGGGGGGGEHGVGTGIKGGGKSRAGGIRPSP